MLARAREQRQFAQPSPDDDNADYRKRFENGLII
jgi:hypothetical protein